MERVENDEMWSLFSPDEAPGLQDVYGESFNDLYCRYENDGLARSVIKARHLWDLVLTSQIETGTPYMMYKDHINEKSNQKHSGIIKSSNLCTEICEATNVNETAVCNLASIGLPEFVIDGKFDFQKMISVIHVIVQNMNRVIDISEYPTKESKFSNLKHRPIGIGVQGLQEVFFKLRYPFDSPEAKKLNIEIFESIYYGALDASCSLAKNYGPYESYEGSPISKGIFQFDMWNAELRYKGWDWVSLRKDIKQYGVRNSLLLALMPTASTSQIFKNTECFEPINSNVYLKRIISGNFIVVNRFLYTDLKKEKLWNDNFVNELMKNRGSIQNIEGIPKHIKDLYKTVWDIKQHVIIDMAADRAPFVDQSQSMSISMEDPDHLKLTRMHFYGWSKGLKTGMYYLRTKPNVYPLQFTVKSETNESKVESKEDLNAFDSISTGKKTIVVFQEKTDDKMEEVCQIGCTNCSL